MIELRPCPGCQRHVSISEVACPFCDGPLVPATPQRTTLAGRLSRAAVFASIAACGPSQKPKDAHVDQPAGSAVTVVDAGVAPADAPVVKTQVREPDRGPCCKPYGAPPARRRIV